MKKLVALFGISVIISVMVYIGCKRSLTEPLRGEELRERCVGTSMEYKEIKRKLNRIEKDSVYIKPALILRARGLVRQDKIEKKGKTLELMGIRVVDTVSSDVLGGTYIIPFDSEEKDDEAGLVLMVGVLKDTVNDTLRFSVWSYPLMLSKEEPTNVGDGMKRYIDTGEWEGYWLYVVDDTKSPQQIQGPRNSAVSCALSIAGGAILGGSSTGSAAGAAVGAAFGAITCVIGLLPDPENPYEPPPCGERRECLCFVCWPNI